jgi:hypothetical protein
MDFLFAKQSPEIIWGTLFAFIVFLFLVGLYCGFTANRDLNKQDKKRKKLSKDSKTR